jgi:hypothetical protein
MDAPFISHQRNRNQRDHHDQDHALFVLSEIENPEQALHFLT